jgi:uncharacterized protein
MRNAPLLVLCFVIAAAASIARADTKAAPGYDVGDRLAKPGKAAPAQGDFKTTDWDALLPKGWDPMKEFKVGDLVIFSDGDPRAMEMLQKMQQAWEKAPVEPSLEGSRIRIPGFVVPLEEKKGELAEFLLVPYFGACIHVPPPPANQIIHVTLAKPVKGTHSMDAVWVSGVLHAIRSEARTGMGLASAGYTMNGTTVEPYKGK